MDNFRELRTLHDQLGLHVVTLTQGRMGWCTECKTIVHMPDVRTCHDIFSAKKNSIRYDGYYIAKVISALSEADKLIVLEDIETRPDIAVQLIGTSTLDQTKLKAIVEKSKIALNKVLKRGQLDQNDLNRMKTTLLGSARLAYGALTTHSAAYFNAADIEQAESVIAKSACYSFQYAYRKKRNTDALRNGASKNARYAFKYAKYVDRKPHDVTRSGAAKAANMAYWYAKLVDGREHPLTLAGAATEPKFAYTYARMIAKRDVPELRAACNSNPYFKSKYEAVFSFSPMPE